MTSANESFPKWREDFPYESEGDDCITRRDFVRFLALVGAGMAVGNGAVMVKALTHKDGSFPAVPVAAVDELPPGTWKVFDYPDAKTPAMLIRRENGEHIAFLQKCPHLACPVSYHAGDEHEGECLRCHCHHGKFDLDTGQGVQGPPRELRPLRQVVLRVENGQVLAVGLNELTIRA